MADIFEVAGRIHSTSQEHVVTPASEIIDETNYTGGKKQDVINTETNQALDEHAVAIRALNSQEYASYTAESGQTLDQILPAEGDADTLYRVGCWDGTGNDGQGAFAEDKYSEYAWNGTDDYLLLSVKSSVEECFDVSAYNSGEAWASLSALLSDTNLATKIPSSLRHGGMSIKFIQNVQGSDNKYVQYRYMGTATTGNPNPFTNIDNWQGVDDEPVAGSENLVKSGGVYDKFLYNSNPNLFDINDFAADKGSDVVINTSVSDDSITISNPTATNEAFRIKLPADDINKTYRLTFNVLYGNRTVSLLLYTSSSTFEAISITDGVGEITFSGGSFRKLGSSIKNLDGTLVISDIVLIEDVEADEYIKPELIKNLDNSNFSEEFNETLDEIITYTPQSLTDEQKEVARNNIGAMPSILVETVPFDYGIKDFYTSAMPTSKPNYFTFVNNNGTLTVSHSTAENVRKTLKINFYDTTTKAGRTYKVIFTIDNPSVLIVSGGSSSLSAYSKNDVITSGSIENGKAEFTVEGAVNAIGFQIDGNFTGSFNITCVVNKVGDVAHDIIDTQYIENIGEENLSDELKEAISYGVDKKRIELTVSAENVTQGEGKYCHVAGSGGIRLSGTGTKTITLSHTDSVGDSAIMTFGLFVPWSTQDVASVALACSGTTHTIAKAEVDSRTEMGHAYRSQGNTYNRVSFYASDVDITITVTTEDPADDWMIEISNSIVLDDVYKKTPILVEYDGGTWDGTITDGGDTFNQWEMHRRLNIPYGINISNAESLSLFNQYATLSVNEGLAEICLRYAGTTYYKDPEADLIGNINETFESLPIATKGVVGLGQSVYDKKLLRCLKKGGVKVVRNSSANNGGITMKGEDEELIVCDGHFMNSKTTIPLYGLPVIVWCHGVGTVSEDDPQKSYYSSGTHVYALLQWLKQKEEEGLVELLSPSEFVERLK